MLALLQFALLGVILYSALYGQDLLGLQPGAERAQRDAADRRARAAAQYGGRWFDRAGVRPPVLVGLVGCTVGLALWAARAAAPDLLVAGAGHGGHRPRHRADVSPTNTDGLARVDEADLAQGSGIMQTLRQIGGTFGVAIIGAVVLALTTTGPT